MSIFDPTQLILERAISGATLRNTVLANNIANADTPGFQPSDVDFQSALRDAIAAGPDTVAALSFDPERGAPVVMRADGSGVDPEAEAAKLAENGLQLNALVDVASARIRILRAAMGAV